MNQKYTAEDGLKILTYLGIRNITEREIHTFKEKWPNFYRNGDVIGAMWMLYAEALPFICGDSDTGSFVVAQLRDSDFVRRLQTTELDKRLREGTSLDEILQEGNHTFIKIISQN